MRPLAGLLLVAAALTACGGSSKDGRIASACRSSRGHVVNTPATGSIVALGRTPVLIRVDNEGNLNAGRVVLGKSSYPGWLAIKTHFVTPPWFHGGFSVRVRGILGSGVVGIGDLPPGGKFSAPAGPAANTTRGWREWPAYTWVKEAGCYVFTISSTGVDERVTVAALSG